MGMAFEIYLGERIFLLNNNNTSLLKKNPTKNSLEFHLKCSDLEAEYFAKDGRSEQDLEISRYISSMIYAIDYEHSNLVDMLLAFPFMNDNESDSVCLLLISRLLILTNLMEHLEKKKFIREEVLSLYQLIDDFVMKNYPLNANEKYFYAKLLEQMAFFYINNNNFADSLKTNLKCIDILEDLHSGFEVNNLNLNVKNPTNYLRLSNQISKYLLIDR
jgi:hypothetical protein